MDKHKLLLAGLSQTSLLNKAEYSEFIKSGHYKKSINNPGLLEIGDKFLNKYGQNVIFLGEETYPKLLSEITDPPKQIFFNGKLNILNQEKVSIVGTRRPSQYGDNFAKKIGARFGLLGISVVSGLAWGIDRISMISCSDFTGVIGVVGEGINSWIKRNHRLSKKFGDRLLLLSEYLPDEPAMKHKFPERNRIIAGLSKSVIVIEAPARSGSLITANLASDYNRDLFALPHRLDNIVGAGCNNLISNYQARLFSGVENVILESNLITPKLISIIFETLNIRPSNISELSALIEISENKIFRLLTKMTAEGILTKSIDGRYKLSKTF